MSSYPPATRRTDPASSRLAEKKLSHSGRRQAQADLVLKLVETLEGSTSRELANVSILDRYQVSRRLADLEHVHKVRKGRQRLCTVGQRPMVTWWLPRPVDERDSFTPADYRRASEGE